MEKLCVECGKKLIGKQRSFCSNKCFGKVRRRKPAYKEQMHKLRIAWEEKNREHLLEYRRNWEHKNYLKRKSKTDRWKLKNSHYHRDYHYRPKSIERDKKYRQSPRAKELIKKRKETFYANHPGYMKNIRTKFKDKIKEDHKKYRKSDKGKATWYNRYDRKRRRNFFYLNKQMDYPKPEVITMLRNRDKVCFYCGCEFDYINNKSIAYPSFDHINPELPLIESNSVICCRLCNASKNDTEVLSWLKKKGYEPSPILLDLLTKQEEFKKCI